MLVSKTRPTETASEENARGTILKWMLFGLICSFVLVAIGLVLHEARTSFWQSRQLSRYAATLTYTLEPGPSDAIRFPAYGPFDVRLGYAQLPRFQERLQRRGMEVSQQARFSDALMQYTQQGLFVPFQEKTQTGLQVYDAHHQLMYGHTYPRQVYASFNDIPPLITQSLLFIENRDLLDTAKPMLNPAVDWLRFSKATLHMAANKAGFDYKTMGASTLATQLEKFRHAPSGITFSPKAKLQQMASASVRAYRYGPETLPARQNLVLSYLNTLPLYGARGYGEVHGLGEGLQVWFGADFGETNQLLNLPEREGDTLLMQGRALRQVLALLIAQRRPAYFFSEAGYSELQDLTGSYLRLLTANGQLSPQLRDAALTQPIILRDLSADTSHTYAAPEKGTLMVRTHLSQMLNQSLYDLDRLDLRVKSTLDYTLQEQVSAYLRQLNDPAFAQSAGLFGERLLSPKRAAEVQYSFTLYETTPQGNLVRVQTDNTDQPFDLNEGSKLELGSTAKLRMLVTYLEVMAEIHQRYADHDVPALRRALNEPQDNLSRWVLRHLLQAKDKSLEATLQASLQRRYSAQPHEVFFTGGGHHTFRNFSNDDNGGFPTVHEAFLKSINLPFIRLTRDVVRYTVHQQTGGSGNLLANPADPRRAVYLQRFADREGQVYLLRYWHKYKGKNPDERFETLLKGMRLNPVRYATVQRMLYPETESVAFEQQLRKRFPKEPRLTHKKAIELYHTYAPDAFSLNDQGYIARVHPLELWLLRQLTLHPEWRWTDAVAQSTDTRQQVYAWLFRTRHKSARDSRIRTMLELDAFVDLQQRWQRLGYPFRELVPSLATAIGSSGDRPEALAELMGIILNDGVRHRTLRIEEIHFASSTPYQTDLRWQEQAGEQVLAPEVARLAHETLLQVVELGTGRRLKGGLPGQEGTALALGGKTGTGDNRTVTLSKYGQRITSRSNNRTATFAFILGDRHFGTVTAYVPGREAEDYSFTSSLPVQVLRGMAPMLVEQLGKESHADSIATARYAVHH